MMENKLMTDNPGRIFGVLPDGRRVDTFEIADKHGIHMHVINYGAIISAIRVPSTAGMLDVVLGFDTLEDYIASRDLPAPPYFGAVAGRYAGRISKGKFSIGDKSYRLNVNKNGNTLHGGINGFDSVLWDVTNLTENSITMKDTSADGEEGFPGELTAAVTYTAEDHQIIIEYEAVCSEDCPVNLTQHTYFNLDGHQGDIRTQELWVNSNKILEIDEHNIPSGNIIPAATKHMDFSHGGTGFYGVDDSFVIDNTSEPAASLRSFSSGLKMTVLSDQPSVHIYAGGNLFGRLRGKHGAPYHTHSGICFESQHYPDSPNRAEFPNTILKKGETYRQRTIWKFENTEA